MGEPAAWRHDAVGRQGGVAGSWDGQGSTAARSNRGRLLLHIRSQTHLHSQTLGRRTPQKNAAISKKMAFGLPR